MGKHVEQHFRALAGHAHACGCNRLDPMRCVCDQLRHVRPAAGSPRRAFICQRRSRPFLPRGRACSCHLYLVAPFQATAQSSVLQEVLTGPVIVTWELYAGESTFSGAATYGDVRLTVLTDGWTANVTLSGPATKWFAVGLDATMHTTAGRRPYAHICTGTRRCHICAGTLLIADSTALGVVSTPATSALGLGSPLPHRDWAHPCDIGPGTGPTPATPTPGLGPPLPHRHRDWVHPCHTCTGRRP